MLEEKHRFSPVLLQNFVMQTNIFTILQLMKHKKIRIIPFSRMIMQMKYYNIYEKSCFYLKIQASGYSDKILFLA